MSHTDPTEYERYIAATRADLEAKLGPPPAGPLVLPWSPDPPATIAPDRAYTVTVRDVRRAIVAARDLAETYRARARTLAADADSTWGDTPADADRLDYDALRLRHAAEVLDMDATELGGYLSGLPHDPAALDTADRLTGAAGGGR